MDRQIDMALSTGNSIDLKIHHEDPKSMMSKDSVCTKGDVSINPDYSATPTNCKGHYYAIAISWYLGMVFLVLFNAILNAGDYFYEIFPEFHPARTFPLMYLVPALLASCVYIFTEQAHENIQWRVQNGFWIFFVSGIGIIVVCVVQEISSMDTRWSFSAVCILVGMAGAGEGICGGGLYGEFSFMHPSYMKAFNSGIGAAGIATSAFRLMTKFLYGDTHLALRNGAWTFLGLACLGLLSGILLYRLVFIRIEAVKSCYLKATIHENSFDASNSYKKPKEVEDVECADSKSSSRLSIRELLYQRWDYILDLLILYGVTFSFVPGFIFENTTALEEDSWYPLVLIAIFCGGDFITRSIPVEQAFMTSRLAIGLCSVILMMLFIPAFYFTTKYGTSGYMLFLCGLLGATNGYFTICIFDTAAQGYKSAEQSVIGNMLYLASLFGFGFGAAANWFWLIR